MKIIYILLLLAICINSYSQTRRSGGYKKNHTKTYKNNLKGNELNSKMNDTVPVVKPRETATERYLKGTSVKNANADTSKSTGTKSPFTSGIHPAPNAGEKFDTTNGNLNVNNTNNDNVVNSLVAAPNDTIFNTNTISANNGVTTNSGAVDRSGQAQFGQTNWGNSRSTVGESQWTIPPPVSASFTKEFPSADDLTWTRNNTDTSIYSARYKSGDTWVTTSYRVSGERLDMRTEVPLTLLPKRVSSYISKLPANASVITITKWQVLGKSDVYEIQTRTGKTMYVNNEGAEVNR